MMTNTLLSLYGFLIILYFFIAPVYDQGLISLDVLSAIKYALLFLIFVCVIFWASISRKIRLTRLDFVFPIVSVLFSWYLVREQNMVFVTFSIWLFYFFGSIAQNMLGFDRVIGWLVCSARLSSLYVIYHFVYGDVSDSLAEDINQNTWALYAIIVFSLLLYYFDKHKNKVDVVLMAALTISILLSGSRGGVLCVFLLLILFLFKTMSVKSIFSIFILTATVGLFLMYTDSTGELRIINQVELVSSGANVDLSSGRIDGYAIGIKLIPDNILLGAGNIDLRDWGLGYRQIHNFYLRVLVEYGVVGFLSLLLLGVGIFRGLATAIIELKFLSYMVLVILVIPTLYEPNGLFGNFMVSGVMWFIVGVIASSRTPSVSIVNTA